MTGNAGETSEGDVGEGKSAWHPLYRSKIEWEGTKAPPAFYIFDHCTSSDLLHCFIPPFLPVLNLR
jgi:hypothetical protein